MEQQTGSKLGKEYKISSCSFYDLHAEHVMLNTRLDEDKLESRLLAEISTASDTQMIPL